MNKDTRLSGVLHVLLHLGQVSVPLTSDVLAHTMGTNPPVFRRTMAGLREAGYVTSEKGHGGGWLLARPLSQITLLDVYTALGRPGLFAFGSRNEAPDCKVEQAVNVALTDTMDKAEALFLESFRTITLDRLLPARASGVSVHCQPTASA
ncbi:Rrf2 family transcriptional regulator [Devosia sp.]|uniref:Rrf2 family transcriptional regulator n=1 Tax=Devosia sp. TaxID=1871048 RepID=UPI003F7113A8